MPSDSNERRPAWWELYALCALLIALIALLERYVSEGPARTILECAAVIVVFGLAVVWRRFNRIAIDLERPPRARQGDDADRRRALH